MLFYVMLVLFNRSMETCWLHHDRSILYGVHSSIFDFISIDGVSHKNIISQEMQWTVAELHPSVDFIVFFHKIDWIVLKHVGFWTVLVIAVPCIVTIYAGLRFHLIERYGKKKLTDMFLVVNCKGDWFIFRHQGYNIQLHFNLQTFTTLKSNIWIFLFLRDHLDGPEAHYAMYKLISVLESRFLFNKWCSILHLTYGVDFVWISYSNYLHKWSEYSRYGQIESCLGAYNRIKIINKRILRDNVQPSRFYVIVFYYILLLSSRGLGGA